MSAPVREPDDNESLNDGALHYAPKRARQVERDHAPESAAPRVNTASWPHTLEPPEPPWKGKKRRGRLSVMLQSRSCAPNWPSRPIEFRSRCPIPRPGYLAAWGGS